MTLKPSKSRFLGSCVIGSTALALETLGVSSGAYYYNEWFPLKVIGVPASIVLMWVAVALLAYYLSLRYGVLVGVLAAYSLDLVLEPLAYYFGLWTWTNTYTPQVYFGSTTANAVVWLGMCLLGVWVYGRLRVE